MVGISLQVSLLLLKNAAQLLFDVHHLIDSSSLSGSWPNLHGDGSSYDQSLKGKLVVLQLLTLVSHILQLLNTSGSVQLLTTFMGGQ